MAAHPYILAAGNKLFPAAFLSSFGFRPCRRRHATAWWFCGQPSACGLMAAFPLPPIVTFMPHAASSPLVCGVGLCMVASCPPPIPRYGARLPRPVAGHLGRRLCPRFGGQRRGNASGNMPATERKHHKCRDKHQRCHHPADDGRLGSI